MPSFRLAALCVVHVLVTVALLLWFVQVAMPYTFYFPETTKHAGTSPDHVAWLTTPAVPTVPARTGPAQTAPSWLRFAHTAQEADAWNRHALLRLAVFHVLLALVTYVVTAHVIIPPYGRHAALSPLRATIPAKVSWVLQESPTLLNVAYFLLVEYPAHAAMTAPAAPPAYAARVWAGVQRMHLGLLLFAIHYIHRSFLYPLSISKAANGVPVHVTWAATVYCLFNGRLQLLACLKPFSPFLDTHVGVCSSHHGSSSFDFVHCALQADSLCGWRDGVSPSVVLRAARLLPFVSIGLCGAFFLAGSYLFFYGLNINTNADYTLLSLRATKPVVSPTSRYVIPRGDLFERVCCPNFLGEIIEWCGYACVVACTTVIPRASDCWCGRESFSWQRWAQADRLAPALAATSFVVYVVANLVPRALAHHAWYARTFGRAYTSLNRKAILPGIL